jgi:proteasome assembly chaperone (PAC2) family protein
MREDV